MHALRSKMTAAKIAGAIAGAAAAVLAFPLSASASGVQLSLSQTLALYGTQLQGAYYNDNTQQNSAITFDFIGDTLSWSPDEYIDAGHRIAISALYNSSSGTNSLAGWRDTAPALIYSCNFTPVVSNSNSYAEVELTPAFTIPSIKMLQQYIYYSGDVDPDSQNVGAAGGTYSNTWCENILSSPYGRERCLALYNGAWQPYNRLYTYADWMGWDANSVTGTLNGTDVPLYGIYNSVPSSSQGQVFDYQGQVLHLNSVRSVVHGPFQENTVYLLIGCPIIDGEYAGPEIPATVTTPTTTRPQWTAETGTTYTTGVTIENFSDDIQEIIRNQRWQLYYQEIQVRNQMAMNENLRQILNRLDDIYNKMNVFQNQQNPIDTNSPFWQEMAGALTGMTTFTMPSEWLQGLTFWGDVTADILVRAPWVVTLGALALSLLVAYYVLFKGRTS